MTTQTPVARSGGDGPEPAARVRIPESVRTAALWLLLVACAVTWTVPQVSIDYRRNRWIPAESLLFLPTGQYLKAASLGYGNLVADVIYLWSIQYYGHHRTSEGRRYLWRIFEVITDLDPNYQDAYVTGALIMASDMDDPETAIQLLERGARNNPDDWIYPVEAATYAWLTLKDYPRAAGYFDRALELPGTPPIVRRIRAGMDEFAGNLQQALGLWVDIYRDAVDRGDERIQAVAWQHIYDIDVEIDLGELRGAIAAFRERTGRLPAALPELVRAGLLASLPLDPDDRPYMYDPASGAIVDPRENRSRASR